MEKPINTLRLVLIPLSQPQLEISLYSIKTLAANLGFPVQHAIFEGIAERAVKMKIDKMEAVPRVFHPWLTYWMIVHKEDNAGIGLIGFKGTPDENGSVEIGYGIDETYRRSGLMSEAVSALVKWAFNHPECKVITASRVLPKNAGSQKVLKKNGFVEVSSDLEGIDFKLERLE